MFITGICKYRDLSAFTSGNYITDLSMDPEYGTLLGYTEDEIKSYFGSYLELAAGSLGIGVNECFEKLKSYYDGFCFDLASSTHVFVPWSVLSFLSAPKSGFMNYWFESGGRSTVLLNFMRNHSLRDPAEYGQDRVMSIMDVSSSRGIDDFSDVILLNQTGYLTIKRREGFSLILNYPNEEVAESMALLYRNRLFGDRDPDSLFNLPVTSLFERYPVEEIPQKLNVIFKGLDYKNYPLKDESSLRAYLQIYLYGLGASVISERHNAYGAYGRTDLEFNAGNRHFVIELKYARVEDDPKKLLEEVAGQIQKRHYGEHEPGRRELVRIVLVFSGAQRSFVQSRIV